MYMCIYGWLFVRNVDKLIIIYIFYIFIVLGIHFLVIYAIEVMIFQHTKVALEGKEILVIIIVVNAYTRRDST